MPTLRMTDGTTTINLSSYAGLSYWPNSGVPGDTIAEDAVLIFEATAANVLAVTDALALMFAAARAEPAQPDTVYVEYQSVVDSVFWRSEIVDGRILWSSDSIRRQLHAAQAVAVEVVIAFERKSEWEGAEAALTWGAGGASSITIKNDNSGTNFNAAEVKDGSIDGSLPTPVKLSLQNINGADVDWSNFYLANDGGYSFPGSDHLLQCGTAWSNVNPVDHNTVQFWMGLSVLDACKGDWFRVVAVFSAISPTLYVRAGLYANPNLPNLPLTTTEEVHSGPLGYELLDLGMLALPPGGYGTVDSGLDLGVTLRGAGFATLAFVALMPADNFLYAHNLGDSGADDDSMVLDGVEGVSYQESGGNRHQGASMVGGPLLLVPNRDNRFTILFDEWNSDRPATYNLTISGSYRPRRLTV